jgi:hypothetical protein
MGSSLIVGRLPSAEAHDDARTYLTAATNAALTSDAQAKLLKRWRAAPKGVAYLDPLNLASQVAFLNHAAALEGLENINEAMERSRWRHLPYWLESYWLPVQSDMAVVHEGGFFGSSCGLIANLAEIAALSPHGLGTVPAHFDLMRSDLRAFYALDLDPVTESESAMLQWVWRALFEAATLSVERNAPMWNG